MSSEKKSDKFSSNETETVDVIKENETSKKSETVKTSKGWIKNKKNEKIKELEKQVEELKSDYLRSRADFDNFRKRKEKELIEARERSVVDFVMDILPSIDNFEMSLKMTENKEMFIKGVEMIHGNLISTLKDNHFVEFEPSISENFDPYKHDPILIEDQTKESGKVLGVLKKGYMYKDKVIRPARVEVVKSTEEKEKLENTTN